MNQDPRKWNCVSWRETSKIPCEPGCYALLDSNDKILYIGRSKILANRLKRPHKHKGFNRVIQKTNSFKIAWCPGWDIYDNEKSLIQQWKPPLCKDLVSERKG